MVISIGSNWSSRLSGNVELELETEAVVVVEAVVDGDVSSKQIWYSPIRSDFACWLSRFNSSVNPGNSSSAAALPLATGLANPACTTSALTNMSSRKINARTTLALSDPSLRILTPTFAFLGSDFRSCLDGEVAVQSGKPPIDGVCAPASETKPDFSSLIVFASKIRTTVSDLNCFSCLSGTWNIDVSDASKKGLCIKLDEIIEIGDNRSARTEGRGMVWTTAGTGSCCTANPTANAGNSISRRIMDLFGAVSVARISSAAKN